jgi:L-2-hydroxyglutarate oxidase LhgO
MYAVNCIVVGAGVVGLAVARDLSRRGKETLVLERESLIGTGTSSRNSGVVHAGIYYPTGSLKARLCVRGKQLLYDHCRVNDIPHSKLGKLLVATTASQVGALEKITIQAKRNGVTDLIPLSPSEANKLESEIQCEAAYLSPSTGIVDVHELMMSLYAGLEKNGGAVLTNSQFIEATPRTRGFEVLVRDTAESIVRCETLINCAGLDSVAVAHRIRMLSPVHIPRLYLAKGHYFKLAGVRNPFTRLVYPMPSDAGLGVHVTLDLSGAAKFGPDVEWINELNFLPDASRVDSFYRAIRAYWPSLPDGVLVADYAGIRPKISGPGEPAADFLIQRPAKHGIAGLINLHGIESPGITSALAIAEMIANEVIE